MKLMVGWTLETPSKLSHVYLKFAIEIDVQYRQKNYQQKYIHFNRTVAILEIAKSLVASIIESLFSS